MVGRQSGTGISVFFCCCQVLNLFVYNILAAAVDATS